MNKFKKGDIVIFNEKVIKEIDDKFCNYNEHLLKLPCKIIEYIGGDIYIVKYPDGTLLYNYNETKNKMFEEVYILGKWLKIYDDIKENYEEWD